ncbi:MAG: hypothetical protein M3R59_06135 [Verrucomicrobiota bacterium]|nr:hypothetical protein [Verrucomicrobiota bacterium]
MSDEAFWPLLAVFLVAWALTAIANLAIQWKLRRGTKKWESDEQILARYKEIKKALELEGKSFDLWHEISAAIARRDWDQSKKKLEASNNWAPFVQWGSQLTAVYFGYHAYSENDQKLFILMALLFIWRSINYHGGRRTQLQILTMAKLPTAPCWG